MSPQPSLASLLRGFIVHHFGTFNPLSKIFLVAKSVFPVISETIFAFFQRFLDKGNLFSYFCHEFLRASRASFGGWVGGCPSLCRFACPASCLPASCPVRLQKIGLLSVPVGVLGACGLLCSFWLLLYRLPAYLVKIGTKGANFPIFCNPFAIPLHGLCNPFACRVGRR